MIEISGSKLITQATVFGTLAVLFVTVPFLYVMIAGIVKINQNTSTETIVSVIIKSLGTHFIACVVIIGLILSLDILNPSETNYFSKKIFEIFWSGNDKSAVFGLVGGGSSNELKGAYAILHLVITIVDFMFALAPIFVFVFAISYGLKVAKKDTYKDSYVGMATWSVISIICCSFLYLIWSKIATLALFLPNQTLYERILNFYTEILLK